MLKLRDISFLSDFVRLPKNLLKDICTELNMENIGTISELGEKIYTKINNNFDVLKTVMDMCANQLFCGKMAITWYKFDQGCLDALNILQETISQNIGFNPFVKIKLPSIEKLSTQPQIIGGVLDEQNNCYLRLAVKGGIRKDYYGSYSEVIVQPNIITTYINVSNGVLEVRTDSRKANKVAECIANAMGQTISLGHRTLLAPFGNNVGNFADAINGELIDATSKPELLLENFTEEQGQTVVDILVALENYFEDDDIEQLQTSLQDANNKFGAHLTAVPFRALILAGMEKIGMGGIRELRGMPLYDCFKPFLQHQGGYITFPFTHSGVEDTYTIRVGLTTNSIYFTTPANEEVVRFVRERLFV